MEEKLIQLVQENKCLYDRRDPNYRNMEVKEEKWKNISEELNAPVDRVKTRWCSLRDRYQREKRKSNNEKTCPWLWKFYEQMSFLNEIPKKRISSNFNKSKTDNVVNPEIDDEFLIKPFFDDDNYKNKTDNNDSLTEQKLAFVEEFVNCFDGTDCDEEVALEDTDFQDYNKFKKRKIAKRKKYDEENKYSKEEDVDELFCKMLSTSLKSLSRLNNFKAKTEIFQILEKYVEKEECNT